jgi:hypothetical protein
MQEFKVKHIYEKLREDELKTHVYVPSLYCLERVADVQVPQVD